MNRKPAVSFVPVLLLAAVAGAAGEQEAKVTADWQYVPESAEAGFNRPSPQKLALSDERPENVLEEVAFRGTRRKYALIRYGTSNSTRVTVVLDQREETEFDLYVDRNRNRIIETKDRVEGTGPARSTALAAELMHDDVATHIPRQVLFRRSALDGGLSFATTGYLAGQVNLAGQKTAVRRVDADGNGFFADPRDRVWLDLDGDGKWDPFTEQFPLVPVLKLAETRYALRSDAIGSRLALEEITGVGTIRIDLASIPAGVQVADLELMLVGEDGAAYSLRGADSAVQVPIGKYAVNSLSLSLSRKADPQPWNFVFSRPRAPEERHWHDIARDAEIIVDPVGPLSFVLELPNGADNVKPGKSVMVEPRLYTHEGLLINSCGIGSHGRTGSHDGPRAEIELLSSRGMARSSAQSGFA